MAAELQFKITLSIDGLGSIGTFDKLTGGDATATPQKHRPGGMGPEIVYPALPIYSNVVLSRVYDDEFRNDHQTIGKLRNVVGKKMGTVTEQPLDANGNAFGSPRTFRGMLADVKDGNVDSMSETPREWSVDLVVVTSNN